MHKHQRIREIQWGVSIKNQIAQCEGQSHKPREECYRNQQNHRELISPRTQD